MKSFNYIVKNILFSGIVGSSLVYATEYTDTTVNSNTEVIAEAMMDDTTIASPTTDDKLNPSIKNNLGAVNILDLSGKDAEGMAITNFRIKTLPDVIQGVLYREDGVTAIVLEENLTQEESDGLRFDPNEHYVGDAAFTYVAVDDYGSIGNVATFTLPLVVANTSVLVPPIVINITPACPPGVVVESNLTTDVTINGSVAASEPLANDTTVTSDVSSNVAVVSSAPATIDTTLTPSVGINENVVGAEASEEQKSSSVPVFNSVGVTLMVLLTTLIGFFYREKESC